MSFALLAQAEAADDRGAIRERIAPLIAEPALTRLIVVPAADGPPDAYLAQAVAALMVAERLDVEVGYAAPGPTEATRRFGLPHGAAGRALAETGTAATVPLIRDDAATVLVGHARHLGGQDARLHGETYVDDHRLFTGTARGVRIEPTLTEPGLRARLESGRRLGRRGAWHVGRAAQTGGTNLVVEREGLLTPRPVKRSTFYRHHIDLLLVRP